MQVQILEVGPPRKLSALAAVKLALLLDDGSSVVLDDFRILRNREGNLWLAPPSFQVPEGKGIRYLPVVQFSRELRRTLEDAAIGVFEAQQAQQTSGGSR